jgi:hypothetical protein
MKAGKPVAAKPPADSEFCASDWALVSVGRHSTDRGRSVLRRKNGVPDVFVGANGDARLSEQG